MENFDESKLKKEFSASADLQAEFGGDVKAYIAFKLAEVQGRVQACRSGGCSMTSVEQFNDEVKLEGLNRKLAANEIELERLRGLQKKNAGDEDSINAAQYASGVSCQV